MPSNNRTPALQNRLDALGHEGKRRPPLERERRARVMADLPALEPVHRPPGGQRKTPTRAAGPADAGRVRRALPRQELH